MTEVLVKPKKTRTPRNAESVLKGALSLPLKDRITLKNDLEDSISKEVSILKLQAAEAEQLANGTK